MSVNVAALADAPIHFDKLPVRGISDLVEHFSTTAFASPFRSTVPLLDMLYRAPEQLRDILAACGVAPTSLHVEYCVEGVPGGNPSQTDLMAVGIGRSLAVEAKWTEPRYETVAKRLLRRTKERAHDKSVPARAADRLVQEQAVLAWLDVLSRYATAPLTLESVDGLVYQTIHRAASACAMGDRPAVLYLHFHMQGSHGGAKIQQYRNDLSALYRSLGRPENFRFFVADQSIIPLESFRAIAGLKKGAIGTAETVKSVLVKEPLFRFERSEVEAIV
jgi:hypothetical protein